MSTFLIIFDTITVGSQRWHDRERQGKSERSQPISRVLSRTIIHLGCMSPCTSSNLPGSSVGHAIAPLFGLAPSGVFRAAACYHPRGALLPHLFTLTDTANRTGGIFSVALSVGSRLPGITWHFALWSPDFPPRLATQRLSGQLRAGVYHRHDPFTTRAQCATAATRQTQRRYHQSAHMVQSTSRICPAPQQIVICAGKADHWIRIAMRFSKL
jgi:hypothetical protein